MFLEFCKHTYKYKQSIIKGNESKKFLDLFPKISILAGGVDSGFRIVKASEYKPRLLHVSGYKKSVQVYQVPLIHDSLNDSNAFVLDCGLKLFQFNGVNCSAREKRKANAIVDELQASRFGKVKDTLIIDGIGDDVNQLIDEFWSYFGGCPKSIKPEDIVSEPPKVILSLHHITDVSGVMEIKQVCSGKLDRSKLNSNDAFILDAGGSVFVWIGKSANKSEKREV